MKIESTSLPGVMLISPKLFGDARGFFFESYNKRALDQALGRDLHFVQDNHSRSSQGVLRGLHFQIQQAQGKLVRVLAGRIYDVAVDLRRSSATFGQWFGVYLDSETKQQLWVPEGFAHGFYVCSETAEVLYKTTDYYAPAFERSLLWNDPTVAISWPLVGEPLIADKDRNGHAWDLAEKFS